VVNYQPWSLKSAGRIQTLDIGLGWPETIVMERKFIFSLENFYHLYNRGSDKRSIFLEEADYSRFIILLYLCNSQKVFHLSDYKGWNFSDFFNIPVTDSLVNIGAYCLMPNHFHLLISPACEGGVSKFMEKLGTAYTMYFNRKYKRTGSLFEGAFKAKEVDSDEYLIYLFSYIHLNPVKIKIGAEDWKRKIIPDPTVVRKYLELYRFSSYLDYLDKPRVAGKILNKEVFPDYFKTAGEFQEYLDKWIDYDSDDLDVPVLLSRVPLAKGNP
jgi:REP element-mobilizing transposase RayT